MLTPEQYEEWEQQQRKRHTEPAKGKDFTNYDSWKVSRYDNTVHRYFVTANKETGEQFKDFVDKGRWHGGRTIENRLFEELQCEYMDTPGSRISRTEIDWNCKFYEVTVYGKPESAFMIVDGHKTYMAEQVSKLKDGYRWHMKLASV